MKEIFQELLLQNHVRENLIALRQRLRAGEDPRALKELMERKGNPLGAFLHHEDAKVRKNAALLLGELGCRQQLPELVSVYSGEETLFVRADYLRAMQQLGYQEYLPMLRQRLREMTAAEIPEESQKHYREEIRQLERMIFSGQERNHHAFCGMEQPFDVVLTTNRLHREVTARQIREYPVTLTPLGVKVAGAHPGRLLHIRTFRELMFALKGKTMSADPAACAEALASSDLLKVLERGLGSFQSCCFRITVVGEMPLEARSSFTKRCGFALEQCIGRRLVNVPEDYEVELRLYLRRDGTFLPLVKFSGFGDHRFDYRRQVVASSMHPSGAALMAALAKPYLKEGAQVLDPFCGVGTMLLERDKAVPAGTMYGVDIFGEAIAGARENARAAGRKIYFVQRDFLEFTHEHMFDEFFTDMPPRGKRTRQEQERLYAGFFDQAKQLLNPGGIIVMYSNEDGYVKKQIRLHGQFRLLKEELIQEKGGYGVYVIGKKKG